MGRYDNTRIKRINYSKTSKSSVRRLRNGSIKYNTTIFNTIPDRDDDIFVITTIGDRLDLLANEFYGTPHLWWYIAKANNLKFMTLPIGTSLGIPSTTEYAIGI